MPVKRYLPSPVVPMILAAGPAPRLGLPHALARFGRRTALEIAIANCRRAGLSTPVVVLGCQAARIQRAVPPGVRVVVNRCWRSGMLSSIRAGLRHVPQGAAFLLYPVDLPLLTPAILRRLLRAFARRRPQQVVVSAIHRARAGHPVIFGPEVRAELAHARTARDVVERKPPRVKLVPVDSRAIYADFDTPSELRRLQHAFTRRSRRAR